MEKTKEKNKQAKKQAGQKAKAIIFDFDDTLVDTKRIAVRKHLAAAEKLSIKFDEKEFLRRYGQPWPKLLFEMIGSDAQSLVRVMGNLDGFVLKQIDGASDAISYARENGFFVGLLSSSERIWVLKKCQETSINLGDFHSRLIFCCDDVKENKPSPLAFEPILSALAAEGLSPNEVYYCGDSIIDMETARNAGVNFIAVTTGVTTAGDFSKKGLGKDMIIPSIKDLPKKLSELKLP